MRVSDYARTADWLHLKCMKKRIGEGLFGLIQTLEPTRNSQMLQDHVYCLSAAKNTSPLLLSELSMMAKEKKTHNIGTDRAIFTLASQSAGYKYRNPLKRKMISDNFPEM